MATIDTFQAGMKYLAGERHDVMKHPGGITTWTNGGWWFAEVEGRDGVGIGLTSDDVLALARTEADD